MCIFGLLVSLNLRIFMLFYTLSTHFSYVWPFCLRFLCYSGATSGRSKVERAREQLLEIHCFAWGARCRCASWWLTVSHLMWYFLLHFHRWSPFVFEHPHISQSFCTSKQIQSVQLIIRMKWGHRGWIHLFSETKEKKTSQSCPHDVTDQWPQGDFSA